MIDVHAGELIPDSPQEQGSDHGGIHAAGQGQQHLFIAHLTANLFDLIRDEIRHIPVGLGPADVEHEGTQRVGQLVLLRPGRQLALRFRRGVIHRQHGQAAGIHLVGHENLAPVHHMVGAAVDDDALDAGQGGQLGGGNVVRINLAVHAQRANSAGDGGVFGAAQIQNDNAILFHAGTQPSSINFLYFL